MASRGPLHGWAAAATTALAVVVVAGGANAKGTPPGDWLAFGRTADQNRHSPLTQITRSNVDQLGRVYKIDFRQIDPTVRRGEQSFPLAKNGILYLTTNDGNVWAVQGATGKIIWRYKPSNIALFRNFGIVANRGLAYCDGKLFVLTLDMHIVSLSPANGRLLKRVAIANAVPGAASNYGYSETSAPMCANNTLVIGAAGSEYGIRGFVMGYHTDLTPAWANPVWTVPPEQQGWRRAGRLVGGGAVWTPVSIDAATNTVFFGTGSATPLFFPSLRPGRNPRTDSLLAVSLSTGRLKWWQQQMGHNEWAYDTAQPPLVYDAKIRGRTRRIVSVATMEGVWFAYDARTGAPIYQRVKVIDRVEHPALRPGKPVTIYPSALGGVNYSPASYDPATHYVFNGAAETAAVVVQQKLTKQQIRAKLVGDVFLGLENGNFGTSPPGWHDHGSISAIDVATGRRVWKFRTSEPERGGITTTDSGLGFAGGGDGFIRAFDTRNGKILWRFQTGHPIAAGPTIFSSGGKEYVAITVGGTPTSSMGGTASELHVFALGGSRQQSLPPKLPSAAREPQAAPPAALATPAARAVGRAPPKQGAPAARLVLPRLLVVRGWQANSSNTVLVVGRLALRGRPVQGARIRVDGYVLRARTDAAGRFRYPADVTVARRHVVGVVGVSGARAGGRPLTARQGTALLHAKGAVTVAYRLGGLSAHVRKDGTVLVSGRVRFLNGAPPPPVVLYTYQLRGTITDASGQPVDGAVVVTRTMDRDFWTFSQPSNSSGAFTSFYTASDEAGQDPVPLAVQVALGQDSYGAPLGVTVKFRKLRSASMDIKLPASPGNPTISEPTSYQGAVYEGLLVGVTGPRGVIKPLAARWPDRSGRFSLVLPASVRGHRLTFWENQRPFFARVAARPGRAVDLRSWPSGLLPRVPQRLASLRVPR